MTDRDALLERPPEAAIRILALPFLDGAAAAAGLLESDGHPEALHDFRVSLRRLRTLLKAYRALLRDSVSRKQARALRDLARSTGAARDAEVQLEWLAAQEKEVKPAARKALAWLVEKVEGRRQAAYAAVRGEVLGRFRDVEGDLRTGLSRYEATLAPDPSRATFALAAARKVRSAGTDLVAALEAVRAPSDVEEAHRARILAKRFRYLLESLQGTSVGEPADRLVRSAKALQEVLGKLHDMHVLAGEIASSLVETAAERARTLHEALYSAEPALPSRDLRSGILAIDRLVRDRVETLFDELHALWPTGRAGTFPAEVEAIAVALVRHGNRESGTGRRFLLASLPRIEAAPIDIAQGWIPGRTLRERLERIAAGGEEHFFRAVQAGSGGGRREVREEASREVFERLWPLTEGRQVRKRRYRVTEGDREWEVDEFLDRELVLAEIAAREPNERVEFPDWLRAHVVREVTGEDPYLDESLGR